MHVTLDSIQKLVWAKWRWEWVDRNRTTGLAACVDFGKVLCQPGSRFAILGFAVARQAHVFEYLDYFATGEHVGKTGDWTGAALHALLLMEKAARPMLADIRLWSDTGPAHFHSKR